MKKQKAKENHAGRLGDLTVDGLSFGVRITEGPRGAYGRNDYKVEPLNGAGTCWVKSDRVTLIPVPDTADCKCGGGARLAYTRSTNYQIACSKCEAHGPGELDLGAAVDAWNAMQKPAEETPTHSFENEVPA